MGAKGTFLIKVDNNLLGFAIVLKAAACEWLLLFFLIVDAAFSYFLTKFAKYCDLQVPCLLCSRLDHVFGKEEPGFYRHLICSDHKSELSSWGLCQNHGKLADVHEMCEECLLSFAKNDVNQEIFKVLVGKLRLDCLQKPFLSMDSHMRSCSCCNKAWKSRPNVQKSVQSKLSNQGSKPDIPLPKPTLPKSPAHKCLNRQEGLKRSKDKFSPSPFMVGHRENDCRSHVRYPMDKVNSDSESDLPFSEDDDNVNVPGLIQRAHETNILMHPDDEPEKGETTTPTCMVPNGHGIQLFGESNLQQICKKAISTYPEFVSLDDVPLSSSAPEISPIVLVDDGEKVSLSNELGSSGLSDSIFPVNSFSSPKKELSTGLSNEKFKENGDLEHASAVINWESIDLNSTSNAMHKGIDETRKDVPSMPNSSAFDDLASSADDQPARRDRNGIGSNEGLVSSELLSSHSNNSTVNGHADGPEIANVPITIESSVPSKIPNKKISCSLESQEELINDSESSSLINKLKQQLEESKKHIDRLQKELEEERNAAAIAANQAMAMITKLQEEKSGLYMESQQYLRMMEELEKYDMEALDKANDMLAEKEKEVQDLEAELDYFRIKYPEEFPECTDMLEDSEEIDESTMDTVDFGP